MKVLSTLVGRVLLFINVDEWVPASGIYLPDVLPLITERYSFALSPALSTSWGKVQDEGIKFEMGKVKTADNEGVPIQDFTVYNNGLVVSGASTDIAQAFVADFFSWAPDAIGLRVPLSVFKFQSFLSEIVVEFDIPMERAVARLTTVMENLKLALQRVYGNEFPPIALGVLRLDYDRAAAPFTFQSLAPFHIERRLNHPFTENVFICRAPLPTKDHTDLLELVESLLSD